MPTARDAAARRCRAGMPPAERDCLSSRRSRRNQRLSLRSAGRYGLTSIVLWVKEAPRCSIRSLEVATAIKLARELEPYDIAWFEEPVSPDDHAGQGEVRRSTTIPIASGEREFTRFDFQDLLERHALDIAQPDVARAGGMTEIRRIAALTSAHGVRLAPMPGAVAVSLPPAFTSRWRPPTATSSR